MHDVDVSFGSVLVTDQVVGFVRKLVSSNEVIEEVALGLLRNAWNNARSGSRSPRA